MCYENGSENVEEEVIKQLIKEDSKLEWEKILRGDYILARIALEVHKKEQISKNITKFMKKIL